ncbi:YqaA family protein [Candidatus Odyssella thessalonicensis]|uniref:YqaA family protein n=1 Tax=Candidatus Odyssella thessalonicensis TaxID=84647 RepID=UPI000527FBEF|nr:YqaA family protein [Candidatus Odyssella thessalonicensis]
MTAVTDTQNKSRLYQWLMRHATSPSARYILAAVSFAESSFFPLPPDFMLIPMIIADRAKAFVLAIICSLSSVLGGVLGYAIGYYFMNTLGQWVIDTYGLEQAFTKFQANFHEYGFWIIALKGLTPIPYKLVTIASGASQLDLGMFVLASLISRTGRFMMLAGVIWYFGEDAKQLFEKNFKLFTIGTIIALLVGLLLVKFLL